MECAYGELCTAAGVQAGDRPSVGKLCLELLGAEPIFSLQEEESTIVRKGRVWHVYVRHDVSDCRARWLAAVEVSRWWILRYVGLTEPYLTPRARRLASCIVAPAAPFVEAVGELGPHPFALAKLFRCEQAMALLRVGETTGRPVFLLDQPRHLVTMRGNPALWKGTRKAWRVQLTDDSRVGLIGRC